MYKNRNITDFFKPFAQPRNKRPLPDDDREDTIVLAQPDLAAPRVKSSNLPEDLLRPSSQLSLDEKSDSPLSSALSSALPTDASIAYGSVGESRSTPTGAPSDPPLSQTAVLASSQRVVKDGEVVIRNSDDESDSDTSLDDIDDILTARKPTADSSPPTENDFSYVPPGGRRIGGSSDGKKRKTRATGCSGDFYSSALPVVPKYKFSLDTLVAQAKKDDAAQATFAQAQSLLNIPSQYNVPGEGAGVNQECKSADFGGKLDAVIVASVMKEQGEENDIERLMSAMQRTEALNQGKIWSFFNNEPSRSAYELPSTPVSPEQESWQHILEGHWSCSAGWLSEADSFKIRIHASKRS